MVDQCCRELDNDAASRCPNDGICYHVEVVWGIPYIIHLCEEHSQENTVAQNPRQEKEVQCENVQQQA